MTDNAIAILELVTVGGTGLLLIIAAAMIKHFANRKKVKCSAHTTGHVIRYKFPGEGRIIPIVEYSVDGRNYTAKKAFNGFITKRVTGIPIPVEAKAWEDEKGYLHIKGGAIMNMKALAEEVWPIGSEMEVHYDPGEPARSYADRYCTNSFTTKMFNIGGLVIILISIGIFFLIRS